MKEKKFLILLLFNVATLLLNAQINNSLHCSKWDSLNNRFEYCYYSLGQLKYSATTLSNFKSIIRFFPNGKLAYVGSSFNSYIAGYSLTFYDNGNLLSEGYYRTVTSNLKMRRKIVSYEIDMDDFIDSGDSSILATENSEYYVPKEGIWKYYYASGNLKQISYYKTHQKFNINSEEEKDGIWEFYNKLGKLVRKTHYKNNKIIKTEIF